MKKTIDATNMKLGRVASVAAYSLMGKDLVDYTPNKVADVEVEILNASKISIDEKKKTEKTYRRYSGYPGGQKEMSLEKMIEKKGYEGALKTAIKGMLPTNKLRSKRMLRLTIKD